MALYTYFPARQLLTTNAKKISAFVFSVLIFFGISSPTFAEWTDNPLKAGETVMKAVHLQEIRDTLDKKCTDGKVLQGFDENQNPICIAANAISGMIGKFVDGTNPTDAVYMDGNVGIGIETPESALEVKGLSSDRYIQRWLNKDGNVVLRVAQDGTIGHNVKIGNIIQASQYSFNNGRSNEGLRLNNDFVELFASGFPFIKGRWNNDTIISPVRNTADNYGDVVIEAGGNERTRFTAEGNVGIGTTTPTEKLDVSGNAKISGKITSASTADDDSATTVTTKDYVDGKISGEIGSIAINSLTDAKTGGNSIFLGSGAGTSDDGSDNRNTAVGINALHSNTTGNDNTANGYASLYSNTTGIQNTANGYGSLYSNTTGSYNTANGLYSLLSNTTGNANTANGYQSLYLNTTGSYNTANGYQSLHSNTTGNYNTANGVNSLYFNTTGNNNTANGFQSLYHNTTGNYNTANGMYSLFFNTTGMQNTVNGYSSLYSNTTGIQNTANGYESLYYNTTGSQNTANGYLSLYSNTTGSQNTANGYTSGRYTNSGGQNQTSNKSVYLGYDTRALASGDTNEIVIGSEAKGNGSNTVTLGNDDVTKTVLKGNVGIGIDDPKAKLEVKDGNISLKTVGETKSSLKWNASDNSTRYYISANSETSGATESENEFKFFNRFGFTSFYNGAEERLRITKNGNVGIGKSSGLTEKLEVDGNVKAKGFILEKLTADPASPKEGQMWIIQ